MSVRVTKLERAPEGYWTANLTVDNVTTPVQKASGSWQTVPDIEGVTHGVLPWAAAELQDRLTAVQLSQATDDKEREALNFLRRAAIASKAMLTRPERTASKAYLAGVNDGRDQGEDFSHGRTYDDPTLNESYDRGVNAGIASVTDIDTKRVAERMAAAGRQAIDGGDAA